MTQPEPMTGRLSKAGDVGVLALEVGDCFDDPATDFDEVLSVPAIPCDQPHDNQAFAKFNLNSGDWPGDDVVSQQALDGCVDRFEPAIGEAYETSPLDVAPLQPTEASWDAGDYEVLCATYNVDLSKLSISVLSDGA